MGNVFQVLCCVYILLLMFWEQTKTSVYSGSPVGEGYMKFAKQPWVPTPWLEFLLTCLDCHYVTHVWMVNHFSCAPLPADLLMTIISS